MDPFYRVETFTPRESIGYLMRRISKLSTSRVEASFDSRDVSFTQWVVLKLISSRIADTCTALARDMDHNSGAMTRLIDQLEERGLIVRNRLEGDRRVSKLSITEAGQTLSDTLLASVVEVWNEIVAALDPAETRQLIDTLTKLLDRLETLEAERGESA
jgi:DNA-binding MarR family transcriptional regulator